MNYSNDTQGNATMLLKEADRIFEKIQASLKNADRETIRLYNDMITKAIDYAGIRSEWLLLSPSERKENLEHRTLLLDTFIVTVNVIAKRFEDIGKSVFWRKLLGSDRKRIGDFACYLTLFYSLNSR